MAARGVNRNDLSGLFHLIRICAAVSGESSRQIFEGKVRVEQVAGCEEFLITAGTARQYWDATLDSQNYKINVRGNGGE